MELTDYEPDRWGRADYTLRPEQEEATIKEQLEDGSLVPHTAAHRSLALAKRALAEAGGRPPRGPDGEAMVWNSMRGWHPRAEGAPAGHSMAEMHAYLDHAERQIRQARVDAEMEKERSLLRSASPNAWRCARMFRVGAPKPTINSPDYVLIGWRIARLGYDYPPMWLRHEQLSRAR